MQGTPVRYAGYTGTVRRVHWYGTQGAWVQHSEVQQGNWVQSSRYACFLGTVRRVHWYGTQGTWAQHWRYRKATGYSVQGRHVVGVWHVRYMGARCMGAVCKVHGGRARLQGT